MTLCAGGRLATIVLTCLFMLGAVAIAQSAERSSLQRDVNLGLPRRSVLAEPKNVISLGRKLFFDRRMSFNQTLSCAMCHVPSQAFASTASRTAVGMEGKGLLRNAPTLLNVGWLPRLFHDGRENSLATQVWLPLLNPIEMANPSVGYLVDKIAALPDYTGLFEAAFGAHGPTMSQIGEALQAFERSLVAAGSPFDRWRYGNVSIAITPEQKAGFDIFDGKGGCSSCHLIGKHDSLFTDNLYHATGVAQYRASDQNQYFAKSVTPGSNLASIELASFQSVNAVDLGRFEISMDPADRFAFRTASLRNVERTAPYMHDGSLPSLEAVVEFYDGGGADVPNKSLLLRPLHLTDVEKKELVAFLKSLSSPAVDDLAREARANGRGE